MKKKDQTIVAVRIRFKVNRLFFLKIDDGGTFRLRKKTNFEKVILGQKLSFLIIFFGFFDFFFFLECFSKRKPVGCLDLAQYIRGTKPLQGYYAPIWRSPTCLKTANGPD